MAPVLPDLPVPAEFRQVRPDRPAVVHLTFFTTVPLNSEPLGILSASVPVAGILYLAWTRRDAGRAANTTGLLAALMALGLVNRS